MFWHIIANDFVIPIQLDSKMQFVANILMGKMKNMWLWV